MFAISAASWYHSPQYNAESKCQHCGGVIRHERWCMTCDPFVRYAFEIVRNSDRLTPGDRLNLHALGVEWKNTPEVTEATAVV